MRRVITYGTFDTLHHGHIRLLRRARALGDYLIVALSTDEFNAIKGKQAYFSFEERKQDLEALRYVDLVIPENTWAQKSQDVRLFQADVFCMGDDWAGKFDELNEFCEVVYLARTPGISSTVIRTRLADAAE
ncbi:MAG: glycerol-3-phosphate cytidylyltransferase [Paracoccus sp. (in: a-proteobacteria)]|uniref:glycerol-3-phosphate cytidylyltransferase n=1 Tax=Paracoccus sp. TaxID=267 RepID=UPI0039E31BCB